MQKVKQTQQQVLHNACSQADWAQIVYNGGPPCFDLENGKFCLRAERWVGHDADHKFVSLESIFQDRNALQTRVVTLEREAEGHRIDKHALDAKCSELMRDQFALLRKRDAALSENARLREEQQKVIACINRGELGIEQKDRSLDDWLAQILQVAASDHGSVKHIDRLLEENGKMREALEKCLFAAGSYRSDMLGLTKCGNGPVLCGGLAITAQFDLHAAATLAELWSPPDPQRDVHFREARAALSTPPATLQDVLDQVTRDNAVIEQMYPTPPAEHGAEEGRKAQVLAELLKHLKRSPSGSTGFCWLEGAVPDVVFEAARALGRTESLVCTLCGSPVDWREAEQVYRHTGPVSDDRYIAQSVCDKYGYPVEALKVEEEPNA